MSSVDVYRLLEETRHRWRRYSGDAEQAVGECIAVLRAVEEHGYLGTLYRTDFEVEGTGAFPVDMLRYACAWPKGESDARAIEDSFDSSARRTVALSKYHRDPVPNLAGDRWASKFRWHVVRVVETVAI